jgi:ParB-like chromosome segregation protein Spo0J
MATATYSKISEPQSENLSGDTSIKVLPIGYLRPSPENDSIYRPVNPDDPTFVALVDSVIANGIMEPIVVSQDYYIVSGHRRYWAAREAGLDTIPVRIINVTRGDDLDAFVRLLREHNQQRVKTFDERTREAMIDVAADDVYDELQVYRKRKFDLGRIRAARVEMGERKRRPELTDAKLQLLIAIQKVLQDNRQFWPLSLRQVHYRLLNDPPLIHVSKPASRYANDEKSYRAAGDVAVRARLEGLIPFETLSDETRPFTSWETWLNAGDFATEQMEGLLRGYSRDLQQSQPRHIEIVAEKLTVRGIVEGVAMEYHIGVGVARGYASIPSRHDLVRRFKQSGRDQLVLVMLTDFDPEGENISESFTRSLRDDFGVDEDQITSVKVALNPEQIKRFGLPKRTLAKESSSRCKKFTAKHGSGAWELESLDPDVLASELRNALDHIIDREAFEHERRREAEDAVVLAGKRKALLTLMGASEP